MSIEETKIAKGIWASNQFLASHDKQCRPQIVRPLGVELKWCSAHRMAECQSGGVKGLTRSNPLERLGEPPGASRDPAAAPATIRRVTNYGVAYVLQMDPDLVGSSGMQLEPEQVDHFESGHDSGIGPRRPPLR